MEVVSLVGTAIGKKASLWKIMEKWVNYTARIGDTFHLLLTAKRLSKLTSSYVVSNAEIKAAIGKPLPIFITDKILHAAASFAPKQVIGKIPAPAFS